MTPASLLLVCLHLAPRSQAGETPPVYTERLATISTAVLDTTAAPGTWGWSWGRKQLAAALLVHMDAESGGFDLRVHAGERHPRWTQDDGRAKCLAQLYHTALVPGWDTLAGTGDTATHHCVSAAARVLSAMARMCVGHSAMTEAGMALTFEAMHGAGCVTPGAESRKRAAEWMRTVGEL